MFMNELDYTAKGRKIMKHVCVNLKEMKYPITLDAFDVELMDIGKGVLHIRCEYKDYYYPLEVVESCVVRNDD